MTCLILLTVDSLLFHSILVDKWQVQSEFWQGFRFHKINFLGDKIKLGFSFRHDICWWFSTAHNSTFAIGVQFVSVWQDFSGWLIRFPKLHLSQNARPSQMCKTLAVRLGRHTTELKTIIILTTNGNYWTLIFNSKDNCFIYDLLLNNIVDSHTIF